MDSSGNGNLVFDGDFLLGGGVKQRSPTVSNVDIARNAASKIKVGSLGGLGFRSQNSDATVHSHTAARLPEAHNEGEKGHPHHVGLFLRRYTVETQSDIGKLELERLGSIGGRIRDYYHQHGVHQVSRRGQPQPYL